LDIWLISYPGLKILGGCWTKWSQGLPRNVSLFLVCQSLAYTFIPFWLAQ